jgi:DNA-binding MarR family transcriptional regulator
MRLYIKRLSLSSPDENIKKLLNEQLGRQLSAYTLLFHQAVAERLGLNSTDLKCLDLARWEPVLTPGRLAELTGLTTAAVTSILDRLEKAGYVQRERDLVDRRKVIVRSLPGRTEEVNHIFLSLDQALSKLYKEYSKEELSLLNEFANRVGQILQSETVKLRQDVNEQKPKHE